MTETDPEEGDDPIITAETVEEEIDESIIETVSEPAPKPRLKIESLDDLKRVLMIAKGGDPDAIQAVANFMDFKSNIERSYFPDKKTSIAIAQLTGYGRTYYPNDEWDPFNLVADCLAIGYMPYKGFKSNQFVDMTKQTPSLADLQTVGEVPTQGVMARLFGRGKEE